VWLLVYAIVKTHLGTNLMVGRRISRILVPLVWINLTFVVHLSDCYGEIVCNAVQKVQSKQTELRYETLIIFLGT
jgi:hypothetical protein